MTSNYVVRIDYPNGESREVGPFDTQEKAELYASRLEIEGLSRLEVKSVRVVKK